MMRVTLTGVNGTNPLGFMAAVGLLRIATRKGHDVRLGFLDDASFSPFLEGLTEPIEELVVADAESAAGNQPWRLQYGKAEKKGTSEVADLKAPPEAFERFLEAGISSWVKGKSEGAEYGAAYGTTVAKDGKGNTKPTAFHFTAANQQFLGTIEAIRAAVDVEWARSSLFAGGASRPGGNVRWDPAADRNYALMAENPNTEGTQVDAPLEWLAFRSLPLFPTLPQGTRVLTTGVRGRGDAMTFSWPLWSDPAGLGAIRSLVSLGWDDQGDSRHWGRSVFAVCSSRIRRTSQGFGNFGPASVQSGRAPLG